jgi:hypothetical protein
MNKIQLKEHIEKIINYVGQEYNHGPKLVMNESKEPVFISEGMFYHIENNLPLNESIYRPQSSMFLKLFVEARNLYDSKRLTLCEADQYYFDNTDIGKFGEYNGIKVPLDLPLTEEFLTEALGEGTFNSQKHIATFSGPDGVADVYKMSDGTYYAQVEGDPDYDMVAKDVAEMAAKLKRDGLITRVAGELNESLSEEKKDPPIGKPKRGGSKKFYVYVRDKGKVKKVSFGMAGGGLRAKLNNPKARAAFSKRHNCPQKKDRTKASYWSCRLPRYAKLLGFKTTFSGYW